MDSGGVIAQISFTSGGQPRKIELFGDYVLRQLGLHPEHNPVAARVGDIAMSYLASGGGDAATSLADILSFLVRIKSSETGTNGGGGDGVDFEAQLQALQAALVQELDACMLSYFAFHWRYSAVLMDQVSDSGERKLLRSIVAAATREGRVRRVMKALKAKRVFTTLVEELRTLGSGGADDRVVAAVAAARRCPVLLLIGGGMGAGKSTAVGEILASTFWAAAAAGAVVVEADAFKEADVVYQAMAAMGEAAVASQVVHQSSTDAASSLLVAALNAGRDVIFDGTMSWAPFVRQTVAMARDVHRRRYRMGVGYHRSDDGSDYIEEYWTPDGDHDDGEDRLPYRIELVGVTCHPLLAVVRGIRRSIVTKRSVPIRGQLRSHKLFAEGIDEYCSLVDQARIYSSNATGGEPELIGFKEGLRGRLLVDPEEFSLVRRIARLNPDAGSFLELFEDSARCCGHWNTAVLSEERTNRQDLLRKLLSGNVDFRSFSMNVKQGEHSPLHHSISAPALRDPPSSSDGT